MRLRTAVYMYSLTVWTCFSGLYLCISVLHLFRMCAIVSHCSQCYFSRIFSSNLYFILYLHFPVLAISAPPTEDVCKQIASGHLPSGDCSAQLHVCQSQHPLRWCRSGRVRSDRFTRDSGSVRVQAVNFLSQKSVLSAFAWRTVEGERPYRAVNCSLRMHWLVRMKLLGICKTDRFCVCCHWAAQKTTHRIGGIVNVNKSGINCGNLKIVIPNFLRCCIISHATVCKRT